MKINTHDTALIETGTMKEYATRGYATPGSTAEYRRTQARRLIIRLIVCFIVIAISAVTVALALPSHQIILFCALMAGIIALLGAHTAICAYASAPGTLQIRSELALRLTPQMRDKLFQASQEEDPKVLEELIRRFEDQVRAEHKKYVNERIHDILEG